MVFNFATFTVTAEKEQKHENHRLSMKLWKWLFFAQFGHTIFGNLGSPS